MSPRQTWSAVLALALILTGGALPRVAAAADLAKLDCALGEIPADAACFSTMLRNREQLDAIAGSKAWAKLTALPLWQLAQGQLNAPGGPMDQFEQWRKLPENRQLADLLGDMFSHEIYFYGGANYSQFSDLMLQLVGGLRFGPALLQVTGEGAGRSQDELMVMSLLNVLANNPNLIQAPDLVIGFKITDAKRAEAQLKRLDDLLQALAQQSPDLKDRYGKTKVGGLDFLTLTLDGKMVPWQHVPFQQYESKPGQYKPLVNKLRALKVTISLGVRGKYLLLGLGESTNHIAGLGQGKRLIDRPELKPLAKFADRPLTGINYVSQALNAQLKPRQGDLDAYLGLANTFLEKGNLKPEQRERIKKDLAELTKKVAVETGEAAATLAFSFLSARGTESFAYDWSKQAGLDGSKPLTLLAHAGGSPLLVGVIRSKSDPQAWPTLVSLAQKGWAYFEEFGLPQMEEENRKHLQQFMKGAKPLLTRFEEVTGKTLLPALQGQLSFVLDARLTSKQWFQGLPAADKPLPMLEPAFGLEHGNAAALENAFSEYRTILNGLIGEYRKTDPNIPQFQLPTPQSRKTPLGSIFFWPPPADLGLDKRLMPVTGVGDKVAVLTITQEHAERLLSPVPLKISGGPLGDPKRALASAFYLDCAGFFDVLAPWVEHGVVTASGGKRGKDTEDMLKQIQTLFDVLKVFRSYSSATYLEDGATVTHSETVIKDQ